MTKLNILKDINVHPPEPSMNETGGPPHATDIWQATRFMLERSEWVYLPFVLIALKEGDVLDLALPTKETCEDKIITRIMFYSTDACCPNTCITYRFVEYEHLNLVYETSPVSGCWARFIRHESQNGE